MRCETLSAMGAMADGVVSSRGMTDASCMTRNWLMKSITKMLQWRSCTEGCSLSGKTDIVRRCCIERDPPSDMADLGVLWHEHTPFAHQHRPHLTIPGIMQLYGSNCLQHPFGGAADCDSSRDVETYGRRCSSAHLLTWHIRVFSGMRTHHPPISIFLTSSSTSKSFSSRVSRSQNSYMKHWNALMNSCAHQLSLSACRQHPHQP